jgi:ABC-type polar amino acid transport system ATPase subunit
VIEFVDVYKKVKDQYILNGVNMRVDSGEVVVICGPSGAGKSTLLRTINKMEYVDRGDITVNGVSICGENCDCRLLRTQIGMVFQHFNLYAHKTVLENITLAPMKVKKLSKKDAHDLAMELLVKMGLETKAKRYPIQLSGGEQQRVAICRSLAMNPSVMLFDEPTSALDIELKNEIIDVMSQLAERGMTLLIVTHELSLAEKLADRAVFMDKGEIIESSVPELLFYKPQHSRTKAFMSNITSAGNAWQLPKRVAKESKHAALEAC